MILRESDQQKTTGQKERNKKHGGTKLGKHLGKNLATLNINGRQMQES